MAIERYTRSDKELLDKFGHFSQKLTHHHQLENLSEFVVHDLCGDELFNLDKAAYLINNPDFECLKGVVGFDQHESFKNAQRKNSWDSLKEFTSHMQNASFNKKVRMVQDLAFDISDNKAEKSKIYSLADQLEIQDPLYHVWPVKHDNHGILIFQKPAHLDLTQKHLPNFLYMLSFCPVF